MSQPQTFHDLDEHDRRLAEVARDASVHAYAPYSGFAVGAAVRTRSGNIFRGANLENAAMETGICAEIAAVASANAAGDFDIEAIAIVGHKFAPPSDSTRIVTPCGRCRQVIFEAAQVSGIEVRVLSCDGDLNRVAVSSISELLPAAFGPDNLEHDSDWRRMLAARFCALTRGAAAGGETGTPNRS